MNIIIYFLLQIDRKLMNARFSLFVFDQSQKPVTQQWLKYQKQNKKKLGVIKTQSMIN